MELKNLEELKQLFILLEKHNIYTFEGLGLKFIRTPQISQQPKKPTAEELLYLSAG